MAYSPNSNVYAMFWNNRKLGTQRVRHFCLGAGEINTVIVSVIFVGIISAYNVACFIFVIRILVIPH